MQVESQTSFNSQIQQLDGLLIDLQNGTKPLTMVDMHALKQWFTDSTLKVNASSQDQYDHADKWFVKFQKIAQLLIYLLQQFINQQQDYKDLIDLINSVLAGCTHILTSGTSFSSVSQMNGSESTVKMSIETVQHYLNRIFQIFRQWIDTTKVQNELKIQLTNTQSNYQAGMSQLSETIRQMEQENQKSIQTNESQLNRLKLDLDIQVNNSAHFETLLQKIAIQVNAKQQQITRYIQLNETVNKELIETRLDYKQLKGKWSYVSEKLYEYDDKTRQLVRQNDKIKQQLEESIKTAHSEQFKATIAMEALPHYQNQNSKLQTEIQILETKLKTKQKQLLTKSQQYDSLIKSNQFQRARLVKYQQVQQRKKYQSMRKEKQELTAKLELQTQSNLAKQVQINLQLKMLTKYDQRQRVSGEITREQMAQIGRLQRIRDNLQDKVKTTQTTIEQYSNSIIGYRSDIAKLQIQVTLYKDSEEKYRKQAAKLDAANLQLKIIKKADLRKVRQQHDQKAKQFEQQSKKLKIAHQKANAQLIETKTKLRQDSINLGIQQLMIETLSSNSKANEQALDKLRQENTQLHKKTEESSFQLINLKKQAFDASQTMIKQLESLNQKNNDLLKQLQQKEIRQTDYKQQIKTLKQKQVRQQTLHNTLQQKNTEIQKKTKTLQFKNSNILAQNEQLVKKITLSNSQLSKVRSEVLNANRIAENLLKTMHTDEEMKKAIQMNQNLQLVYLTRQRQYLVTLFKNVQERQINQILRECLNGQFKQIKSEVKRMDTIGRRKYNKFQNQINKIRQDVATELAKNKKKTLGAAQYSSKRLQSFEDEMTELKTKDDRMKIEIEKIQARMLYQARMKIPSQKIKIWTQNNLKALFP